MKKIVIYLFLIPFLFASCNENVLTPEDLSSEQFKLIDFKGETVKISADFPEEFFNQSLEDFSNYLEHKVNRNTRAISGSSLTYDELEEILSKIAKKYPAVNYNKISDEDLKRIMIDIPSINSLKDALSKVEIIFEYYSTLAKNDAVKEYLTFNSKKANLKISESSDDAPLPEQIFLIDNPLRGLQYVRAANLAKSTTQSEWGGDDGNGKANAFQHSVWNCFIISKIIKYTPSSKTSAINFAQNGTSYHEMTNEGAQIHDADAAMDLHNNQAARNWMSDEVKWGVFGLRKMPSNSDIITYWKNQALNSSFYDRNNSGWVGILNLHGGNNSTTWNKLYNNLYSTRNHNVHIRN